MALGDVDLAFEFLERGYQTRSEFMLYLNVDPIYDPIRADPRFTSLLRRIGFPVEAPRP